MAGSHGVAAFSCCLDTINDNPPCQMAMLKLGMRHVFLHTDLIARVVYMTRYLTTTLYLLQT